MQDIDFKPPADNEPLQIDHKLPEPPAKVQQPVDQVKSFKFDELPKRMLSRALDETMETPNYPLTPKLTKNFSAANSTKVTIVSGCRYPISMLNNASTHHTQGRELNFIPEISENKNGKFST